MTKEEFFKDFQGRESKEFQEWASKYFDGLSNLYESLGLEFPFSYLSSDGLMVHKDDIHSMDLYTLCKNEA